MLKLTQRCSSGGQTRNTSAVAPPEDMLAGAMGPFMYCEADRRPARALRPHLPRRTPTARSTVSRCRDMDTASYYVTPAPATTPPRGRDLRGLRALIENPDQGCNAARGTWS